MAQSANICYTLFKDRGGSRRGAIHEGILRQSDMRNNNRRASDESLSPREDYFDDYWETEEKPAKSVTRHMNESQREQYYRQKDAYYASRDAYYAKRDADYAAMEDDGYDDDYADDEDDDEVPGRFTRERTAPRRRRRRRRKGHFFRRLVLLLLFAGLIALLLGTPPVRNPYQLKRADSHSTVLLGATYKDGSGADTVMLLSLKRGEEGVRLLSIPTDIYAPEYPVPILGAAYGAGGEEELMRAAEKVLGFSPDGYLLLDLDFFIRAADLLGGLDFSVPRDMEYTDETLALDMTFKAGDQHLSGRQVVSLVRCWAGRNGENGDAQALRELLRAAFSQWLRPSTLGSASELWTLFRRNADTDLTVRNLLWIARVMVKTNPETVSVDVLPGWTEGAGAYSVYVLERSGTDALLRKYDPYL